MATLNTDFLRDLHLRIFCAFARLGFDDYSWYSDEDLSLLISVANTELAELNKTRLEKETELQKQKAKNSLPKTIQSLEKEIHKKIEEIEKFENKINPYKTEQKKRSNPE